MLIEIHMIQNHSPSNLNRDDLGAPKTCIFGGVTRARISSQCLKRSIRRSGAFKSAMANGGGVRTRSLVREIARRASGSEHPPDVLTNRIRRVFEEGGLTFTNVEGDPNATEILWFLPNSAIDKMADSVRSNTGDLAASIASILGERPSVPDIALSGRMTEFDAQGPFENIGSFRVEAALAAAHAISTHEVINEVDYFTAVDDLATGTGAGHVNEAMFSSACFYKHFCIDWDQVLKNLGNDVALATLTVRQFLYAAAMSTPSGKQKSFAAFNPPEGVLVEIKTEQRLPVSYANAFADPVPPRSPRGLIGESIARLGQHVHDIANGYGITATRLWFSPSNRHSFTYVEGKKEMPVIDDDGYISSFDELVKRVMNMVGSASGAAL
jgi:CRISPR system Cascade subunit CasC